MRILIVDDSIERHEELEERFNKLYKHKNRYEYELDHAYSPSEAVLHIAASVDFNMAPDVMYVNEGKLEEADPENMLYDEIYLDHDLGLESATGVSVAHALTCFAKEYKDKKIVIISNNSVGSVQMQSILQYAGFTEVTYSPWTT